MRGSRRSGSTRESLLFTFRRRVRQVSPGTEEVLEKMRVGERSHEVIGRSLIVETSDRVIVRFHGDTFIDDTVYEREEITEANIQPISLSSFVKQRKYYWKP